MTDTAPLAALRARLTDGRGAVGVAGLGYVGLPLAVEFAHAGFSVRGIDPDTERVRSVGRGESHVEALPSVSTADCVVIHTDHDSVDYEWLVAPARLVFATRNATRDVRVDRTRVVRL